MTTKLLDTQSTPRVLTRGTIYILLLITYFYDKIINVKYGGELWKKS